MEKKDQVRQVIHLYFIESKKHHYFGSISAMFECFSRDQLGVASQTLYNTWKDELYINEKVEIRKGRLIQKRRSKNE
jgi:hypothetical protein